MTLWHYTCRDHAPEIERDGFLRPNLGLVWMTDLDEPDREGLGLTSRLLACDRTEYRFRILEPETAVSWSQARRTVRPTLVEALERAPGARPEHWWIARGRVRVIADQGTR